MKALITAITCFLQLTLPVTRFADILKIQNSSTRTGGFTTGTFRTSASSHLWL
jgi:hypothetical protein